MSKQSQASQDPKNREEAEAPLQSDINELAPESGSREAQAAKTRAQVLARLAENKEAIPFDVLMAEVEQIEQGNNAAADQLCQSLSKYIRRIPKAENGEPGWHAEGREKGPLTKEQSEELAKAINAKIDPEKMRVTAEENRIAAEKRKARKEAAKDVSEEEIIEGLITIISALSEPDDLRKLKEIALDANRSGLIRMTDTGVAPIKDKKGSHELAQAINSKKKELMQKSDEALERERTDRRIIGFEKTLNNITASDALESYVWLKLHRESRFLNKIENPKAPKGTRDWTVVAIEGKYGSQQLVNLVLARKEQIKKLEADRAETERKIKDQEAEAQRKKALAKVGDKYKIVKR